MITILDSKYEKEAKTVFLRKKDLNNPDFQIQEFPRINVRALLRKGILIAKQIGGERNGSN